MLTYCKYKALRSAQMLRTTVLASLFYSEPSLYWVNRRYTGRYVDSFVIYKATYYVVHNDGFNTYNDGLL